MNNYYRRTNMNVLNKNILSVCIELTDKCNVGCPYCLLEQPREYQNDDLILEALEMLNSVGVQRFTFGGGEPLFAKNIYKWGGYLIDKGKNTLLRTSACIDIDIEKVRNSFRVVDISVDSHSKDIMAICKPNINCDIVFNNICKLVGIDVLLRCNILITKYNIDDVINTVNWLIAVGVKNIRIQPLVPRGKAKTIFNEISINDLEFMELYQKVENVCVVNNTNLELLKSVSTQTLCIVKPNGDLFIGNPTGIIPAGTVFNIRDLQRVAEVISENQKKYYE